METFLRYSLGKVMSKISRHVQFAVHKNIFNVSRHEAAHHFKQYCMFEAYQLFQYYAEERSY